LLQDFDGWLFGHFRNVDQITGDELIFVFDDHKTVLRGKWRKGNMIGAKRGKIVKYK